MISLMSNGLSRVYSSITGSKASILCHSAFLIVQLSHPYMTTGKTIALTIWTYVGKVYKDHELLIAKFRLKLKKVAKTTRPFRYDLNHTPYDYTVEVTNRFKGLDLIECLKNYGQRFVT